jgi:hypothetical protein
MWEAVTGQGSDKSFSKKKNFFRYRLSPFVSGLVYIGKHLTTAYCMLPNRYTNRIAQHIPTTLLR